MAREFKAKKAAILTNPTAQTVFVAAENVNQAAVAWCAQGATDFLIRASGNATGGTTANFTPQIQLGNSITAGSNTNIITGGAAAFNTAGGPWGIVAEMWYDQDSKKLSGSVSGINASTGALIAAVAATQLTSGIDLMNAPAPFVCTGIFSAGNAANVCKLYDLSVHIMSTWGM